jgi:asparagine synthase (glutamine-hydrolysing)
MCGIVGLTGIDDVHILSAMNDLLVHRGPDDKGEYVDREGGVALAMRRLSIIDLESGQQPMSNEDGRLWVVCNGEIYNAPELRRELEAQGHSFKTRNSDVEVLLHLYEEKGQDLLHDLNGMYAFVLYDKGKGVLFGARDRLGIKPFYYTCKKGRFAFASELKSLLLLPWIARDIDFTSLYHYISLQFVPSPDTIFRDIKKLSAGHCFTYSLAERNFRARAYWDPDVTTSEERSADAWAEIIRESLENAVRRWTLSDVPFGCSLSGGLDSSSIVGLLASTGGKDIRTYSLGFGSPHEQKCNELPLARKVSEKWGTKHQEIVLRPDKILEDIGKMVWHLDEPYGGGLPSWYIYELIGRDVKVCLTGTGGDELFGNYWKYTVYEKGGWYRKFEAVKESLALSSLREYKNSIKYPIGHFYHRYFSDAVKDEIIFRGHDVTDEGTEAYIGELWKKSGAGDPRNAVAYVDFKLQLPEEFLLVTDRFSMAHSVEARTPFLDHTVVELVYKMPPRMRTGDGDYKSFFKKIVADLLPEELVNAPKKGFVLPLETWTRHELRPMIEDLLSPEFLKRQGIFSEALFYRIVKPHISGRRNLTPQVWTLLMFQLWHKQYQRAG